MPRGTDPALTTEDDVSPTRRYTSEIHSVGAFV